MNFGWMRRLVPVSMAFLLVSCGGGGGGGGNGDLGGGISGKVPYLVSGPSVTSAVSVNDPTRYAVTVTLEAEGPIGVFAAEVFINDVTGNGDFTFIDLINKPGTKLWTGSTNTFVPLSPGQYLIEQIVLDDGDWNTADPLGTGWYIVEPLFSSSMYYVDERITSNTPAFLYYGGGLTSKPVKRFALP
jgi:hypothetical protein